VPVGLGRASSLLSREAELHRLRDFQEGVNFAPNLVILGEPGIGKTSLWEAGLQIAREAGFVVLTARPSEAETALPFAALRDLVEGVPPDVLASLPAPHVRALEVALRMADPVGAPPDPLAISAGFLGALRMLAVQGRLMIAIDDAQWLDASSTTPILFAARRLMTDTNVRFLLARRTGEPSAIERALQPGGLEVVELGALSLGAVRHLLSERLGLVLARRELCRLHEVSGGNPLFALELGRLLSAHEMLEIGAELPLPALIEDVFGDRIEELPESTQRVVLAVALGGVLSRSQLSALVDLCALEDAITAGLLVCDGTRILPAHPLVAAAAKRRSSAGQRHALHLGLASVVEDVTLRARHLAMATLRPDPDIAQVAASACEMALERGAKDEAEELAAHACRLTPKDAPERADRLLALARRHIDAGDLPRAYKLLSDEVSDLPTRRHRALGHLLLGLAADHSEEERQLELALAEAGNDPDIRATVLERKTMQLALAWVKRVDQAEAIAREALAAARLASSDAETRVLAALAWTLILQGHSFEEILESRRSREAESSVSDSPVDQVLAIRHAFRGEVIEAREILQRLRADAHRTGDLFMVMRLDLNLCELAVRCGDAVAAGRELENFMEWSAQDQIGVIGARLRMQIAALTGAPAETARWATAFAESSDPILTSRWDLLEATRARGLNALFERDPVRAVEYLWSVWAHAAREHVDNPGVFPVAADLVEALVQSGDVARAREVTESLERSARKQQHPWGLATASRCAATLALAGGYDEAAARAMRDAAADYARLAMNFDQARCLLALGRAERRFRKNGAARRSLTESAALFDRGGCTGWAAQARAELARVSGRRNSSTQNSLTPGERQVATLAARGMSNKEIAGKLFVSVYTVEAHLSHVYAKLAIRSRTQLARRLNQE
jgi:DNA-binding CsgD family transcriptional regulator/tetratricopeptide (TPR) repeat protein